VLLAIKMSTKQAKLPDHFVLEDLGDAAINFFIDLLQKHPIVWNKSLPDYKNNIKKGLAFKEMDVEMRTAGHTSKGNLLMNKLIMAGIKGTPTEWAH
jgi:hypothetical protein